MEDKWDFQEKNQKYGNLYTLRFGNKEFFQIFIDSQGFNKVDCCRRTLTNLSVHCDSNNNEIEWISNQIHGKYAPWSEYIPKAAINRFTSFLKTSYQHKFTLGKLTSIVCVHIHLVNPHSCLKRKITFKLFNAIFFSPLKIVSFIEFSFKFIKEKLCLYFLKAK